MKHYLISLAFLFRIYIVYNKTHFSNKYEGWKFLYWHASLLCRRMFESLPWYFWLIGIFGNVRYPPLFFFTQLRLGISFRSLITSNISFSRISHETSLFEKFLTTRNLSCLEPRKVHVSNTSSEMRLTSRVIYRVQWATGGGSVNLLLLAHSSAQLNEYSRDR